MKKSSILISVLVPLSLLVACGGTPTATNTPPPPIPVAQQQNTPPVAQKIADSADWPYAYLISEDPANFDAKTKEAIAGFTVTSATLPNGSKVIKLKATEPQYQDQSYALKPGQKLYFIEKFLQDDVNGQEKNMGDDKVVVTESDGTIVQQ